MWSGKRKRTDKRTEERRDYNGFAEERKKILSPTAVNKFARLLLN